MKKKNIELPSKKNINKVYRFGKILLFAVAQGMLNNFILLAMFGFIKIKKCTK